MDQNSNMGGFAPMPGQEGIGGNDTVVMPTGSQGTPAMAGMGAASMNNTLPNPVAATPNMAQMQAPVMPGMPAPGMQGMQPSAAAVAAAPAKKKDTTFVETIILVVVCLIAAAAIVFAVIFFMQYNELKTDYDSKMGLEVAEAVRQQEEADNAKLNKQ